MNKVFKVVWNKARGCYVVASEFAKSHTKSGRRMKAVAMAAAVALTLGVNGLALAADIDAGTGDGVAYGNGSATVKETDTAIGKSAQALGTEYETVDKDGNKIKYSGHTTAIGNEAKAEFYGSTALGTGAQALGEAYTVTVNQQTFIYKGASTAIGKDSLAEMYASTAIGAGAQALERHSTALGFESEASGVDSIALGYTAQATGSNSSALGHTAIASGSNSTALGFLSLSSGEESTAVGFSAQAIGSNSTALGHDAIAFEKNSTALGFESEALGAASTAVGRQAQATAQNTTALGHNAVASGSNSISLGFGSGASGSSSTALGYNAKAYGYGSVSLGHATIAGDIYVTNDMYAIAVGDRAHATDLYSIALGFTSRATGEDSIAQGRRAVAFDDNTIAIGYNAQAGSGTVTWTDTYTSKITNDSSIDAQYAMAIGYNAKAYANKSLSLGYNASVSENANSALAIGYQARGYDEYVTAIGYNAKAGTSNKTEQRAKATAVGYYATASGESSTAVGDNAKSYGVSTIAIGTNAEAGVGGTTWGYYTAAIGYEAKAKAEDSLALGHGAEVAREANKALAVGAEAHAYGINNVALGAGSNDEQDGNAIVGGYAKTVTGNIILGKKIEDYELDQDSKKIIISGSVGTGEEGLLKYSDIKDFAGLGAVGTVSIGSAGNERTITHVAAGRIAADSTDAINGSQLYLVATDLKKQINDMNEHYHTVNGQNSNSTLSGNTSSSTNNNAGTSGSGVTTGTAPAGNTPELDKGYVGQDDNLSIKYATDDKGKTYYDISLNSNLKLDSVTFGDTVINNGGIEFKNGNSITQNEINYGNTFITDNSVKVGDTINIDNSTKNISVGKDVNVDMGGNQIHNVAAGTADTDAVNVSQLKQVEQSITNNSVQINKLGSRIDKVGAGAAALAALHPLDFDPDDKFYLSAGYGNYRGENAVAIGAFYQPNDDTLFSISSTVGNDDDMINAGVTWRFGQSSNQSRSKKAMAKEIIELRTEVAELKALVYNLTGYGLDLEKTKIFPDTPENHWAYDYVAVAAGNGILEGYPDGQFDGSRPMTRYEMAAVVYRMLKRGAQVDNRMLLEFAPELARIKVDTVTKHKDGTPSIQRVRVIEGRG